MHRLLRSVVLLKIQRFYLVYQFYIPKIPDVNSKLTAIYHHQKLRKFCKSRKGHRHCSQRSGYIKRLNISPNRCQPKGTRTPPFCLFKSQHRCARTSSFADLTNNDNDFVRIIIKPYSTIVRAKQTHRQRERERV